MTKLLDADWLRGVELFHLNCTAVPQNTYTEVNHAAYSATRVSHAMMFLAHAYLRLEQQFFKFIRKGTGVEIPAIPNIVKCLTE